MLSPNTDIKTLIETSSAGTGIKVSAFANTAGAIAYTAMRGWLE